MTTVLVVACTVNPPQPRAVSLVSAPQSIFGVTTRSEWSNLCTHAQAADIGARWGRTSVSWAQHEKTQGAWVLDDLDEWFRGFERVRIQPVVFVSDNPTWAATSRCGVIDKVPMQRFAEFLGALAERFDGDGDYNGDGMVDGPDLPEVLTWQPYNEPDNRWTTGEASTFDGCWGREPLKFAELLRLTTLAVHQANPNARVVFGVAAEDVVCPDTWSCAGEPVFNFDIDGQDFVDVVLAAYTDFDVFDLHYYPAFHNRWDAWGTGIIGKAQYYRQRLAARGYTVPVMVSETGRRSDAGQVIDGGPGSQGEQATYLAKTYVRAMAASIGPVLWFSLADLTSPNEGGLAGWGLLASGNIPKLAYSAYKTLAGLVEQATFVQSLSLPIGQEGYLFRQPGGQALYAVWGMGTFWLDAVGATVVTRDGARSQVGSVGGQVSVALSDIPIYILPVQPAATLYVRRVNAGGPVYTDMRGQVWQADQRYTTGGWGYVGGLVYAVGDYIQNTADVRLYQDARYWSASANPGYRFTVPNGRYKVTVKLAEVYWWNVGMRRFDIVAEGVPVVTNYDLFLQTGGRYIADSDKVVTVDVADGVLDIAFLVRAGYDYPLVNAIEVMGQ